MYILSHNKLIISNLNYVLSFIKFSTICIKFLWRHKLHFVYKSNNFISVSRWILKGFPSIIMCYINSWKHNALYFWLKSKFNPSQLCQECDSTQKLFFSQIMVIIWNGCSEIDSIYNFPVIYIILPVKCYEFCSFSVNFFNGNNRQPWPMNLW